MTRQNTLPLSYFPDFHTEEALSCLQQICTPLDQAQPGDIVAVIVSFMASDGYSAALPVTDLLIVTDPMKSVFQRVGVADLPTEQFQKVACPILVLQAKNDYAHGPAETLSLAFDLHTGQTFDGFVTPFGVIFSNEIFADNYFEDDPKANITQNVVNISVSAVYAGSLQTSHEVVEANTYLEQMLQIANQMASVHGPGGWDENNFLALPDLNSVRIFQ